MVVVVLRNQRRPTVFPLSVVEKGGGEHMKAMISSLVLSGLLCSGVALAQETGNAPEQSTAPQSEHGGHGDHHGGNPDERLAHMTKRYNLTAEQQSQIKPILEDGQQQMQTLRADTSLSQQDRMAKFQSLHQEQSQKISAVLTDEQRKKFDADQQKQHEHRAERGSENGAPPPQ
jgi:Spy/CpxP family protein refolding chaperone